MDVRVVTCSGGWCVGGHLLCTRLFTVWREDEQVPCFEHVIPPKEAGFLRFWMFEPRIYVGGDGNPVVFFAGPRDDIPGYVWACVPDRAGWIGDLTWSRKRTVCE